MSSKKNFFFITIRQHNLTYLNSIGDNDLTGSYVLFLSCLLVCMFTYFPVMCMIMESSLKMF